MPCIAAYVTTCNHIFIHTFSKTHCLCIDLPCKSGAIKHVSWGRGIWRDKGEDEQQTNSSVPTRESSENPQASTALLSLAGRTLLAAARVGSQVTLRGEPRSGEHNTKADLAACSKTADPCCVPSPGLPTACYRLVNADNAPALTPHSVP